MLSGDNGILQKSTEAKRTTEIAEIIETAQMDILGKQTENHGSLSEAELIQILTSSDYNTQGTLSDEESILDRTLTSKDGKYEIPVSKIFRGTLSNIEESITDKINSKIGTVVNGYSAQDLEWQVYYADDNETFLISTTSAKSNWKVPIRGETKSSDYNGSADVKNSNYGANWNNKWLQECSTDSILENAKATAYLCDSSNWSEYVNSPATYAVGGPTIELFIASWNKSQGTNISLLDNELTSVGFDYVSGISYPEPQTSTNNGAYNCGDNVWISSPHKLRDGSDLFCVYGYGSLGAMSNGTSAGIRPIVSIPTSKINISEDTVTVLP